MKQATTEAMIAIIAGGDSCTPLVITTSPTGARVRDVGRVSRNSLRDRETEIDQNLRAVLLNGRIVVAFFMKLGKRFEKIRRLS